MTLRFTFSSLSKSYTIALSTPVWNMHPRGEGGINARRPFEEGNHRLTALQLSLSYRLVPTSKILLEYCISFFLSDTL